MLDRLRDIREALDSFYNSKNYPQVDGSIVHEYRSLKNFVSIKNQISTLISQWESEEWQDISTAPKDGEWIQLWKEGWDAPWVAQRAEIDDEDCWFDGSAVEGDEDGPTHWKPAPLPKDKALTGDNGEVGNGDRS